MDQFADADGIIEWQNSWNTGIEAIDSDHRIVIRLINDLRRAAGRESETEMARAALHMMLEYSNFHFLREEHMLEDCGYPDLYGHQEKHRAFARAVQNRIDRLEEVPEERIGRDFLAFLERWWVSHILQEDMAYRDCVLRGGTDAA